MAMTRRTAYAELVRDAYRVMAAAAALRALPVAAPVPIVQPQLLLMAAPVVHLHPFDEFLLRRARLQEILGGLRPSTPLREALARIRGQARIRREARIQASLDRLRAEHETGFYGPFDEVDTRQLLEAFEDLDDRRRRRRYGIRPPNAYEVETASESDAEPDTRSEQESEQESEQPEPERQPEPLYFDDELEDIVY